MPRRLSELETTRGKQVPKRRELLVRRIIPWRSFNLERERITQIQNEKYKSGRWCLPRYTIFLFTLCWGQWYNLRREATKSSVRAYLMSWILVHISACEWMGKEKVESFSCSLFVGLLLFFRKVKRSLLLSILLFIASPFYNLGSFLFFTLSRSIYLKLFVLMGREGLTRAFLDIPYLQGLVNWKPEQFQGYMHL